VPLLSSSRGRRPADEFGSRYYLFFITCVVGLLVAFNYYKGFASSKIQVRDLILWKSAQWKFSFYYIATHVAAHGGFNFLMLPLSFKPKTYNNYTKMGQKAHCFEFK
jgi:hypothetical protein